MGEFRFDGIGKEDNSVALEGGLLEWGEAKRRGRPGTDEEWRRWGRTVAEWDTTRGEEADKVCCRKVGTIGRVLKTR